MCEVSTDRGFSSFSSFSDNALFPLFQQAIVKQNACLACADQSQCADVYFGVLTKGTLAALQTYSSMVMDLLSARGNAHGDSAVAGVSHSPTRMRPTCSRVWLSGFPVIVDGGPVDSDALGIVVIGLTARRPCGTWLWSRSGKEVTERLVCLVLCACVCERAFVCTYFVRFMCCACACGDGCMSV